MEIIHRLAENPALCMLVSGILGLWGIMGLRGMLTDLLKMHRTKASMKKIYQTNSPAETEAVGAALAAILTPGTIIAYTGDLGAGKTAFTRGLARGLGCTGRVTSPTFTIVNEYEGKVPLFHFDMYRLGDSDDLFDIGWEDYLARGGVCAVEWSENVEDALEEDTIRVDIRRGEGDDDRIIRLTNAPEL